MFIGSLYINNFRLLNNIDIKLGKFITAITGLNATGKSTILGLLGHCGELRKPKPLLQVAFKAELSEILKFSEKHDSTIRDLATLKFEDVPTIALGGFPKELQYRSTLQKYRDGRRYRILPKSTQQWHKSGKIPWPTLYLGLGRLYPIGESIKVAEERLKGKISDQEKEFILVHIKSILSMQEVPEDFSTASISETNKKKAIGVNTKTYDYLSNSAGQDNLGQILMAVLSFRKLKDYLGSQWYGGLLVVDELDAALHPLAQNKLVDFLYKQAEEIGMQIVFTTHSLGLLDYISRKTDHNDPEGINYCELVCLSNANGPVEIIPNPSFDRIYGQLMADYSKSSGRKIPVFSEDEQSRYFLDKLLQKYSSRITLLNASFGCTNLMKMLSEDVTNFSKYIYVIDGDVDETIIDNCRKKVSPRKLTCIVKLPGGKSPERVIWDYLDNLKHDHEFLQWGKEEVGYTLLSLREAGPLSNKYNGQSKEREKLKAWFSDNLQLIDDVFDYWVKDNESDVENFVTEFVEAFNSVARRSFIPVIRKEK
jgi:hypothetical protein